MNINSTNGSINALNSSSSSTLEKVATGLKINKVSDNSSALSIAQNLDAQRSTMYQSLSNVNSGIAMSNIAQGGLKEQSSILDEIQTLSLQALSDTTSVEGKEAIKEQISKYIDQYDNIANSTTYAGTNLLTGDNKDLSVISDEDLLIDMQSVETKTASHNMRVHLNKFTLDTDAVNDLYDAASMGQNVANEYASQFATASNAMESSGRSSLATATSVAQASSTLVDVDYGKAVSDFSKTNIMAQIGMLASTQANAVQQRSVSLLS